MFLLFFPANVKFVCLMYGYRINSFFACFECIDNTQVVVNSTPNQFSLDLLSCQESCRVLLLLCIYGKKYFYFYGNRWAIERRIITSFTIHRQVVCRVVLVKKNTSKKNEAKCGRKFKSVNDANQLVNFCCFCFYSQILLFREWHPQD